MARICRFFLVMRSSSESWHASFSTRKTCVNGRRGQRDACLHGWGKIRSRRGKIDRVKVSLFQMFERVRRFVDSKNQHCRFGCSNFLVRGSQYFFENSSKNNYFHIQGNWAHRSKRYLRLSESEKSSFLSRLVGWTWFALLLRGWPKLLSHLAKLLAPSQGNYKLTIWRWDPKLVTRDTRAKMSSTEATYR